MKLKSLVIIFLILGFFIATAVRPADAFDAKVSVVSEFSEAVAVATREATKDDPGYFPETDDEFYTEIAAVSEYARTLKVVVEGYSRKLRYGDVEMEFYQGDLLYLQHTPAPRNVTTKQCVVTVPELVDEGYDWIRVIVRDDDGNSPIFTWIPKKAVADKLLADDVTFTPNAKGWDTSVLEMYNSLYVNATVVAPKNVYMWLIDDDGAVITDSDAMGTEVELMLPINSFSDDPMEIRYTDAGSYGDANSDGWDGNYYYIDVPEVTMKKYFDSANSLNARTYFDPEAETYAVLVPESNLVDDAGNTIEVSYKSETDDTVTPEVDLMEVKDHDYHVLPCAFPLAEDLIEDWTWDNERVVVEMQVAGKTYYLGVDDGVGPRLIGAYVEYDNNTKLTLEFSENLNASKIGSLTKDDIQITGATVRVSSVAIDPENPMNLIVTTDRAIDEDPLKYVNITEDNDTIMDAAGNLAYVLKDAQMIAVERKVVRVVVTGVTRSNVEEDQRTTIEIEFDENMDAASILPVNFYVEAVAGLEEDLTTYEDVEEDTGDEIFEENAEIVDASLSADTDRIVILQVRGVIEKTDEDSLPKVKIGSEVKGSTEGPVRKADLATSHAPEDEVGPYITYASFNMNPIAGMSARELCEEDRHKLTLLFSERVTSGIYRDTFSPNYIDEALDRASISSCVKDPNGDWKVDITISHRIADDQSIWLFTAPGFSEDRVISIDFAHDVTDTSGNIASDPTFAVQIMDATPLWVEEAKTVDADENGIVDEVVINFGKNIGGISSSDYADAKVVKVEGDPNIVESVTKTAGNAMTVALYEYNEQFEIDRNADTAWTPELRIDLDEDAGIIIEDVQSGFDLTEPFEIDTEDGVAPVLTNVKVEAGINTIPAFPKKLTDSDIYHYTVQFKFSEAMDPNIYSGDHDPVDAPRYFETTTDNFEDEKVLTFLTPDSDPPAGSSTSLTCRGNLITILLESDVPPEDLVTNPVTLILKDADEDYPFDDLNGNKYTNSISDRTLELRKGIDEDYYALPEECQVEDDDGNLVPGIFRSSQANTIYGRIVDPDGEPVAVGTSVYAFSRDELFPSHEVVDPDDDSVEEIPHGFVIDPLNAYGATFVHEFVEEEDQGSFYMKVYGKALEDEKGFEDGDAIIIVVCQNPAAAEPTYEIVTTACLGNAEFSVKYEEDRKTPNKKDLYVGRSQIIKLQPGWNLISTDTLGAYVDSTMGVNPDDYTGYIYAPEDDLVEAGSLPSAAQVYSMSDISDVLFTLSNAKFPGNQFYNPVSAQGPVLDRLCDRLNYTPAFATGHGYYIYLEDVDYADHQGWEIVLFGDKVPDADYKMKVTGSQNLVGHFGGYAYYNWRGINSVADIAGFRGIEDEMLIQVDEVGCYDADDETVIVGLNVSDILGNTLEPSVISTYWNVLQYQYVADWFAELESEFNNLRFLVPGNGYWLIVDGVDADEAIFVNYYMPPEED